MCWIERGFEADDVSTSFDGAFFMADDIVDNNPFPRFQIFINRWFMPTYSVKSPT